ncbi:DUF6528 family protein [Streptomyces sp. NPDC059355]|uniref:DUF6528 family protein n=1 Tax=Streptomyces sp. NPDC059355 TaxID=3346811 RepID=UPI0036A83627
MARAADNYDVAVCEQLKNQILIHPAGVAWTPANRVWSWTPPAVTGNPWRLLSDVKFRNTTRFGWIALVAASGGKVGMVNIGDDDRLLWQAGPEGNPHSIERIPDLGVVVTASSEQRGTDLDGYPGFLTVYGPTNSDDPGTLAKVQEIKYQGAHGLWYDGSYLWALGTWTITKYQVTGDHRTTRLEKVWGHTFPTAFNGHSLDTDRSDPAYLLITGGGSVQRLRKSDGALSAMTPTAGGVKSFARVATGESFWLQAGTSPDWWNSYIQFFDSAGAKSFARSLEGYGYTGQFYKARLSSVAFS